MSEKSSPAKSGKSWIFWVILIPGLFAAFQFLPIREWLVILQDWIQSLGVWGPIAFVFIYILATVFLLPGSAMTPLSGLLFGLGWGTLWVIIASNLGANLAFIIGRYFARDAVAKKIEGNEKFAAIDRAVGQDGWKIVGLTRLSPVFPFVLLNYAYGLTSVKWIHFAIASLIGMVPGTVMYVYFGSLGKLAAESDQAGVGKIALTAVGLVATVLVTVLITRTAKKALQAKTDIELE
ncbi:MAG: TVP38/TMEM64 family protein [Verrucomicrobiales bacterium]|nr:TVP38/TMEM64 family protein [Verrucomicrobiales bacterium]